MSPLVGIIMGSDSDWPTVAPAAEALAEFGVPFEVGVMSAHRTPERMLSYAKSAHERGLKAIIACAGGAAHLLGMVAAASALLASDHADVAHLSLARTAAELLGAPRTPQPPRHMPVSVRSMRTEEHGHLRFVPPPLLLDGRAVEYAQGPGRYGGADPWFLDRAPGGRD